MSNQPLKILAIIAGFSLLLILSLRFFWTGYPQLPQLTERGIELPTIVESQSQDKEAAESDTPTDTKASTLEISADTPPDIASLIRQPAYAAGNIDSLTSDELILMQENGQQLNFQVLTTTRFFAIVTNEHGVVSAPLQTRQIEPVSISPGQRASVYLDQDGQLATVFVLKLR